EDFGLHLQLFLVLDFGRVHAELEAFVLRVEPVHRGVLQVSGRAAAECAADGVTQKSRAESLEYRKQECHVVTPLWNSVCVFAELRVVGGLRPIALILWQTGQRGRT